MEAITEEHLTILGDARGTQLTRMGSLAEFQEWLKTVNSICYEAITIPTAAKLAGVTRQALFKKADRGELYTFTFISIDQRGREKELKLTLVCIRKIQEIYQKKLDLDYRKGRLEIEEYHKQLGHIIKTSTAKDRGSLKEK